MQVYRDHPPRLQLHPGLRELLVRLGTGRRLGVVSDGWLAVQQRKFQALSLEGLFNAVVFSDEWGPEFWKPHPRPFETMLARLKCPATDAVYIGDNPTKDFIGCRRLNMSTIHLRLPAGVYRDVSPATPDHAADRVVSSIAELAEVLVGAETRVAGSGKQVDVAGRVAFFGYRVENRSELVGFGRRRSEPGDSMLILPSHPFCR